MMDSSSAEILKNEVEMLKLRLKILETTKKAPGYSTPGVVGLAGFGTTTFLLQFHNFNVIGIGPIIWLGIMYGGLAQFIAGIQSFNNGDNFGYCAFTTYGAFWMSFAGVVIFNTAGFMKSSETDIGLMMFCFFVMTAILMVVAAKHNCGVFFVFLTLTIGFLLLGAALCGNSPSCKIAAASVLIVCAVAAWYVMAHLLFKDAYGRDLLPVGPAPTDLFNKFFGKRTETVGAAQEPYVHHH